MALVRIQQFAGLLPEVAAKLLPEHNAQIAHNCLLTDGKLRPMAKWVEVSRVAYDYWKGVAYDPKRGAPFAYSAYDPVTLTEAPFAEGYTIAAIGPEGGNFFDQAIMRFPTADTDGQWVGINGAAVYANVTYTRSYDSIKPVNRVYAATRVRKYGNRAEEGPLWIIGGQDARAVVYEGDLVRIEMYADGTDGVNAYRLYRSVTGLDTGQATTNDLDTNWHLVDEIPFSQGNLEYVDGASATASPLDVCYSQSFHKPVIAARYLGLSESGWFVAAATNGDVQVSERYLHHAWPTENQFKIPAEVTDMVVKGDNAYFGTKGVPFIMAMSFGDKALQGRVDRYGEELPCLPNTMTATAFGAMYASGAGLVSLTRDGVEVVTRDIASAGTVFGARRITYTSGPPWNPTIVDENMAISFGTTAFGHYHGGKYYGFCYVPEPTYVGGET